MATYTVTTSNWNSAAFWSSVNETGPSHNLYFNSLPNTYTVNYDPSAGLLTINDGSTTYSIGDATYGGAADATLGGTTQFSYLNRVRDGEGDDTYEGTAGDDFHVFYDNFGDNTVAGGGGDDYIGVYTSTVGVTYTALTADSGTATSGSNSIDWSDIEFFDGSDVDDVADFSALTTGIGYYTWGGDDTVFGGQDGNTIIHYGTTGSLTAVTYGGNDYVEGRDEGDDISLGAGDDSTFGFAGNDTLRGEGGADTLYGGSGDDLLSGGTGNDLLSGDDGDDTFSFTDGFGADTVQGGADTDEIDLSGLTGPITVAHGDSSGGTITDGADTLSFSSIEGLTLTSHGDYFESTSTEGNQGGDVSGGAGDDTLIGARGDHTLRGGDGDDEIHAGRGGSTLEGGEGNDTFFANFATVSSKTNTYSGGIGFDVVFIEGTNVDPYSYNISLTAGSDTYNNVYTDIEGIYGGSGNDTLSGSTADNLLSGGIGNDSISGGSGNDTLTGGTGDDSIAGGDGADFLKTGQGQDTLDGGAGNDTLMNAAGDDSLVGGAGDDLIVATQGNDTLEGGTGSDTLMGGTDNDSLDGGADDDLLLGDLAGVEFNATGTDGVGLASNITDFPTTALTIELTFSSTDLSNETPLISYALSAAQSNEFLLQVESGSLLVILDGSTSIDTGISAATLFDGNLHTLAFSWTNDTGAMEIYLDGTSVYSGTHATGTVLEAGGTLAVGQEQDALGGGFDTNQIFEGTIYGARLYDDVRTPSEIADTVHAPVADTSDTNLIANWVADPNSATFTDQTGSYPMTMSGDVQSGWSAGDDTLTGGDGADTIYGGGGGDLIEGGGGANIIDGGAGDDTITVGDPEASLPSGTPITDGDSVQGTAGGDSFVWNTDGGSTTNLTLGDGVGTGGSTDGDGAADTVYVADTDDGGLLQVLQFDAGLDQIVLPETPTSISNTTASAGRSDFVVTYANGNAQTFRIFHTGGTTTDDTLFFTTASGGSSTGSSVSGGEGNDLITGGIGDDTLAGGDGDDSIVGGDGNDLLTTGLGNDTLEGGDGDDTLMNSDGDDSLDGGAGDDSIVATGGEDTLRGGTGADTMEGGDDADTFIIEDGFGNDSITGGEGTTDPGDEDYDTIDLTALSGPVTVTYTGDEAGTITDGTDTITFSEIERIILTDQNDVVDGGADSAGMEIDGQGGNDSIVGGSGDDTLITGDGQDTLRGGAGDDSLVSNNTAGGGFANLEGGAGADTLDGSAGNYDIASYTSSGSAVDIDLTDGTAESGGDAAGDTLIGIEQIDASNHDDTIVLDNSGMQVTARDGNDTVTGGSGSDTIQAGDGSDSVVAGDGDDVVDGGAGADTLQGNAGSDTISGGDDGDIIDGGTGDDDLQGDAGQDTILGQSGNDSLSGGADDDQLFGHDDDDTLDGGTGNDSLTGGDGNDTFVYNPGDGADTITDFNTGNTGTLDDGDSTNNDFINLSSYYDHISELYADQADDGILNQSNTTDSRGNAVDYSDNTEFSSGEGITFTGASADSSSFTEENTGVVCFAAGTLIDTPLGPVEVEKLRPGDLVSTYNGPPQSLIWTGQTDLKLNVGVCNPQQTPVRIKPDAGTGSRALLVSPQHCILMQLGDGEEVFVRARHLAEETTLASFARGRVAVRYIHLCLNAHHILIADGRPSESFYPGQWAVSRLKQYDRARLLRALPALGQEDGLTHFGPLAAPVLTRKALQVHWRSASIIFCDQKTRLAERQLRSFDFTSSTFVESRV